MSDHNPLNCVKCTFNVKNYLSAIFQCNIYATYMKHSNMILAYIRSYLARPFHATYTVGLDLYM